MLSNGRVLFALPQGGMIEWLILTCWCRTQGYGAILVTNRKRILLFSKPKYFFQILFGRASYADLFLSAEKGPRLLFCPSHERSQLFTPTPVEKLLCEVYLSAKGKQEQSRYSFIPIFMLWRKHARGLVRSPSEYLLGLSSNPNLIGKIWYLFRKRRDSIVKALESFPLSSQQTSDTGDDIEESEGMRIAKSLRRRILILWNQEARVVLGPPFQSPIAVKETLLRDPELQKLISEVAAAEGVDRRKVMSRAYQYLTEIVANYRIRFVEVMYVLLTWLFTRVFEGLVVDEAELKRLRELMRLKPIVFVPCHRSHLDYLIIPYLLFMHDMATPFIVAGINLGFWPVGKLLRMGGAFFIRRSFRGNPLYAACLKKYVEYLLKNRYNTKFFIEGTRSRSGKMLAPAYGILKMMLDAVDRRIVEDIAFVPVSICYDEVPEQGSYSKELGGGQKTQESTGALLRSRGIIKRRFGKVYVKLAQPVYARMLLDASHEQGFDDKLTLQKTAFQICKTINDVTPITPKSILCSVLLTGPKPTISLQEILSRCDTLAGYVAWTGQPMSTEPGDGFKRSIEQTVRKLQRAGTVTAVDGVPKGYACDSKRRALLNFYKNNAIHSLITPSIVLIGFFRTLSEKGVQSPSDFHRDFVDSVLWLRNLLKFDFFFSPTSVFLHELDRNVGFVTETEGEQWKQMGVTDLLSAIQRVLPDWTHVQMFFRLSAELIESYVTALLFLKENQETMDRKTWQQRVVKFAEHRQSNRLIRFSESVSVQNYSNALLLFDNLTFVAIGGDVEKTIQFKAWDEEMDTLHDQLYAVLNLMEMSPDAVLDSGTPWRVTE